MSRFSVLSVLTSSEQHDGLSARNISFHRPASMLHSALLNMEHSLPPQTVPRHIIQTGSTWSHALRHHASYMNSWLDLNPEYEYSFFSDEHARRFVEKHGLPREVAAYRRILTGSQRADLFRVVFLKTAGGVYADLDEELRRPMRALIGGTDAAGKTVPADSTAVIGSFWPFEFLVFAPHHPFMVATARQMVDGIMLQVGLQRNRSAHACKSPHECIIRVTGPLAYTSGVGEATHAPGGCNNRVRTPRRGECASSTDPLLRQMHICVGDAGTIWNSWSCGFARHWDCRNSERRRTCPQKHYARVKGLGFFDLSDPFP